jgi:hypothetical protein
MLVYVRPSNEALLRARVPGAQDQHGCPFNPFLSCALREQEGGYAALYHAHLDDAIFRSDPSELAHFLFKGMGAD